MRAILKNNKTKVNFSLVGAVNTVIDFGVLLVLTSLSIPILFANFISTTSAFSFSFFANKKYTFKTSGTSIRREIILFTIVTLFGLWVLQGIMIKIIMLLIEDTLPPATAIIIAKTIASMLSLVWNYFLYSRVVFKQTKNRF